MPLSNGHISSTENTLLTNDDAPYDSESDLSEVAVPNVDDAASPATSTNHQSEFGAHDTDASESSAAEAQDASDDGDFDMEDSPRAVTTNSARADRSTSAESRRPAKRKVGVEEDEHIKANPELYGLRRSVMCTCNSLHDSEVLTSCYRGVPYSIEQLYTTPLTQK